MSLLSIPIGKDAPREVHAIIEIPKGSSNKYEYDLKLNAFVLGFGGHPRGASLKGDGAAP
jgi:inorganic pyrophosphatase